MPVLGRPRVLVALLQQEVQVEGRLVLSGRRGNSGRPGVAAAAAVRPCRGRRRRRRVHRVTPSDCQR